MQADDLKCTRLHSVSFFLYWFRTEFSGGKTSDIDIDDSLDCAKKTQPKQPCKHALNETKWTSRNRRVDCKSRIVKSGLQLGEQQEQKLCRDWICSDRADYQKTNKL